MIEGELTVGEQIVVDDEDPFRVIADPRGPVYQIPPGTIFTHLRADWIGNERFFILKGQDGETFPIPCDAVYAYCSRVRIEDK